MSNCSKQCVLNARVRACVCVLWTRLWKLMPSSPPSLEATISTCLFLPQTNFSFRMDVFWCLSSLTRSPSSHRKHSVSLVTVDDPTPTPSSLSPRRMKYIKTFAPQCANSLIFGTIPMQSSTVLVSTKRSSCSITLPWLLSTWHFLSSKRPWPSCLSASVSIIRNEIRSWFGVALPVWPLPLWWFGFFGQQFQIKAAEQFDLCSCWRRGLNEMTRHGFSRRTQACLWHMTHVYTSEEIFVLAQPRFHYMNYVLSWRHLKMSWEQIYFHLCSIHYQLLVSFFSSSTCF